MDRIQLIGTEEIQSAGYAMERAARMIDHSATTLLTVQREQQQWMDNWLERFEAAVRSLHATENSGQ